MKPGKAMKYLEQGGLACPFCGTWDIEGGSMDFDAGEIQIALTIPRFFLCAMGPQVWNLTGIENALLSFLHDTAPFLWN